MENKNIYRNINCDYMVVIHRLWTDGKRKRGGLDKVIDFLVEKKKKILLIEHPLEGLAEEPTLENYQTIITQVSQDGFHEIFRKNIRKHSPSISWIYEVWFNSKIIRSLKKKPIYISSDPLNNLSAIFNPTHLKFKYFHCVDYSENRFSNPILNFIYHWIQIRSFTVFDVIGVVSQKTRARFVDLGCSANKLFLVPNSPPFIKMGKLKKTAFTVLFQCRGIIKKYNIDIAVEIIKGLKPKFPKIKLLLAGSTNLDKKYVNEIQTKIKKYHLENNVIFLGFMAPSEFEKYLKSSQLGLSFNSKSIDYYAKYGDSIKIREYALYGIPTISDDSNSTAFEMVDHGAGIIVTTSKQGVVEIESILNNKLLYQGLSNHAIDWAKKMDKNKILERLYKIIDK